MIFTDIFSHIISLLYLISTITGIAAIKSSLICKTKFSGVWLSTIASIGFLTLHMEYSTLENFTATGIERDRAWSIVHIVSAISFTMLHITIIRKLQGFSNEK